MDSGRSGCLRARRADRRIPGCEPATFATMRHRLVSLATLSAVTVSVLVAPAVAGKLGRKIADSGFHAGGAMLDTKVSGHKRILFRGTSNPRQTITGTWSVNCYVAPRMAVYHDDGGLPLIPSGVVVKKVKLPKRDYDYCFVTPSISIVGTGSQPVGSARLQVFVRPLR
jgi:hypothetical protein